MKDRKLNFEEEKNFAPKTALVKLKIDIKILKTCKTKKVAQ